MNTARCVVARARSAITRGCTPRGSEESVNGALAESFRPGPASLGALAPETRNELLALFPELGPDLLRPARHLLRGWEAGALTG